MWGPPTESLRRAFPRSSRLGGPGLLHVAFVQKSVADWSRLDCIVSKERAEFMHDGGSLHVACENVLLSREAVFLTSEFANPSACLMRSLVVK